MSDANGEGTVRDGLNGRLPNGHFARGNALAAGNPIAKRMWVMRAKLLNAVSGEDVERIGRSMARLAAEGDTTAAKIILDYVVGRPAQAIELSGPDGSPLGIVQLQAVLLDALRDYPEARAAVGRKLRALALAQSGPAGAEGEGENGGDDPS